MCSYNPTDGSGKSLCFAILPFALDDIIIYIYSHVGSIALIVSPYKVLMKDQVSLLAPTLMVKFTVGMACMQVSSLSSRGLSPYKVLMKDQVSLLAPTLMVKFTVGMACMQVSSLSSRGLSAAYGLVPFEHIGLVMYV